MQRPTTVLGLTLELLRVRGLTRHAMVGALALSTGALGLVSAGLCARESPNEAVRAQAVAAWHAPSERGAHFVEPTLVATPSGWLLAWTRWDKGSDRLQVAALHRDGTLRGAPVTLSSPDMLVGHPNLARGPNGSAVVWSATASEAWRPQAWIALVDDDAKVRVAPRQVTHSDTPIVFAQVAYGGDGWAIGWPRLGRGRGYELATLHADGTDRGEPAHVEDPNTFLDASLTWNGSAFLVTQTSYVFERDESALRLRWFNREGRPFANTSFATARGTPGHLRTATRGSSTWITWGEDSNYTPRHDPRIARVEDRAVTAGPTALGPRRSGSVPSIACAGDGCTLAWAEIENNRHAIAGYYTQRVSPDGSALGAPRVIPAPELARVWTEAAIANSLDERETLAVFTAFHRERGGLYIVRLNHDGAPVAPGQELPLP